MLELYSGNWYVCLPPQHTPQACWSDGSNTSIWNSGCGSIYLLNTSAVCPLNSVAGKAIPDGAIPDFEACCFCISSAFHVKAGSRSSAEADVQILFSKVHVKAVGRVRLWTVFWRIDSWLLQRS